jgi:hypothetical protein
VKKARAVATRSPTTRDLEWAAGFLEGEGSFTAGRIEDSACEVVTAVQINTEPLGKLKELFGGAISLHERPNQKDFFQWRVSGARARGVMMTLYVLVSEKRQSRSRSLYLESQDHSI